MRVSDDLFIFLGGRVVVIRRVASIARLPGFKYQLHPLLAGDLGTNLFPRLLASNAYIIGLLED